jgi:hypothetical protein
MILKHVKWANAEEAHVGKKLCAINVWERCRKAKIDGEKGISEPAASIPIQPISEGDQETLYKDFRARNNFLPLSSERAGTHTLGAIKKGAKHTTPYCPYIPIEKVQTDDEGADSKDHFPAGLRQLEKRIEVLATALDAYFGSKGKDQPVYQTMKRYGQHIYRIGTATRRPTMDQLMAADRVARLEWQELMRYHTPKGLDPHSTQKYILIEAIEETMNSRNTLWNDTVYTLQYRRDAHSNYGNYNASKGGSKQSHARGQPYHHTVAGTMSSDSAEKGKSKGKMHMTKGKGKGKGKTLPQTLPYTNPETGIAVCPFYNTGTCFYAQSCFKDHVCNKCGRKHPASQCDR